MTYPETTAYLFAQLPMFQRIGAAAYKADLKNTEALMALLDQPQHAFPSVHVAGTNGKGSTSHSLAAVFQAAGYKTGLYTSPHLKDFRERIRINGIPITEQAVVDFVADNKEAFDLIEPSFFEMTVALAFDYFAKEHVDIAIVEVGMGGRLDSTNVIMPELSIITNISFDHTQFLGETLPLIAEEKAGIIKLKTPVIIGETNPETCSVFNEKAQLMRAPILFADQRYHLQNTQRKGQHVIADCFCQDEARFEQLHFDLQGFYQERNLCTILAALDQLKKQFPLSDEQIRQGLAQVTSSTGLLGRWQTLSEKPLTICDTGHNEGGLKYIVQQLSQTPHQQLHLVIGMVGDKDIRKNLSLLPPEAHYYFCRAQLPRALESERLREQAQEFQLQGQAYPTVAEAYQAAQKAASDQDLIFIGGSTFVVAEVV